MQSLFQSCRQWIVRYLALAALVAIAISLRFPVLKIAILAALIPAGLLWFGIAYILGAIGGKGGDAQLIRKSREGGHPQDGERIAVCGTVSAGFETLEAPISRRRAVAYSYRAIPYGRRQAAVLDGFALAPMTIDGPRGSIRILAAPDLDYPYERFPDRENLREYIEKTEWTVHEGADFAREVAHMKTVLADDDGRIRYDIRREKLEDQPLSTLTLEEKILAPGEKVCAIGWYSSGRNALVPHTTALMHSVKIMKGDADDVIRRTAASGIGNTILGCGCMLPVLLAAIIALALVPLDAIEQIRPDKDPSWTEVRMEKFIQRNVRTRYEVLRSFGTVSILLDEGHARGRLNDTQLTRASANATDEITLTNDDGSQGVVVQFAGDRVASARVIHGAAIPEACVEVEQLVRDDDELTGRITCLSKDLNLRVAFHARKRS